MSSSVGMFFPNIWKKCSKPPTSLKCSKARISWSGYGPMPCYPGQHQNSGQMDVHPDFTHAITVIMIIMCNWNRCRKHGTQWRYPQPRTPAFLSLVQMVLVHCCIRLPNCNMQPCMSALEIYNQTPSELEEHVSWRVGDSLKLPWIRNKPISPSF